MIRVIKTGTGEAPVFFCDYCNQRIKDIGLALYCWKELDAVRREEGKEPEYVISRNHPSVLMEEGRIYTIHKACIDQFEEKHGGDNYDWPNLELIDLIHFLIHNGGLTVKDIQERRDSYEELGF